MELWADICRREVELAARLVRGLREGGDGPALEDSMLAVVENAEKAVHLLGSHRRGGNGGGSLGAFTTPDLKKMLDCDKYLKQFDVADEFSVKKTAWAQFLVGRLQEVAGEQKRQKSS